MVTFRNYDEKERIDRVWYQSSNIVFTECLDNPDSLKTLTVTFKNNRRYRYDDVDVNDYVMFMHGGLDGSNGKAFSKYIVSKYKGVKIEDASSDYVQLLLEKYQKKEENTEAEKPTEN